MQGFKCADCGKLPPETESAYTLIGGKSGWRLTRHKDNSGNVVSEWRCPDCWAAHKKANPSAPKGPPTSQPKGSRRP